MMIVQPGRFTPTPASVLLTTPAMAAQDTTIADASTEYDATYQAWQAFDSSSVTKWASAGGGAVGQWLRRKFSSAKTVTSYSLSSVAPNNAISWDLQGWSGSAWVTVDSRSAQSIGDGAVYSYTVASPGAYTQYRLYINSAATTVVWLGDFALYGY